MNLPARNRSPTMVLAQTKAMNGKSQRCFRLSQKSASNSLEHQKVSAYDEDATLSIDHLLSLPTCTGRIGATGMCLGGHLSYRAALDKRVRAAVCYFATDIHSHTLGEGKNDDSLARAGDIKGELVMVRFPCLSLGE